MSGVGEQQIINRMIEAMPAQAIGPTVALETSPVLLSRQQHTLAAPIERSGIGLHSGIVTQVRILPAAANQGRFFVRVDLPDQPVIPASIQQVGQTLLSTELQMGAATVRTIEHLLAALSGMGVDNARIEINGSEVPLLDGSAQDWAITIAAAGLIPQAEPRVHRTIAHPLWLQEGDAFVAAFPASELRFTYGIDFDLPAIGNQWYSWSPSQENFLMAIAPARTFGLVHQIEHLQQQGLIKGGSLENALVCSETGWINPPLRFANEPVRHKLLDLVGDLSLLGSFPYAHVLAYKASHQLHTRFAQQFMQVLLPV